MVRIEDFEGAANLIHFAKRLYDMGYEKLVKEYFSVYNNSDDIYELYYSIQNEIPSLLYDECHMVSSRYIESEYFLLFSEEIDEFYELAQKYGKTKNISIKENNFIRDTVRYVEKQMHFSYSTDGKFAYFRKPRNPQHKHKAMIVLSICFEQEYIDMFWFLEALINIKTWFNKKNEELKKLIENYENGEGEKVA